MMTGVPDGSEDSERPLESNLQACRSGETYTMIKVATHLITERNPIWAKNLNLERNGHHDYSRIKSKCEAE